MIAKMKDQLDATTDMCQHLLREQRRLSCQMTGNNSLTPIGLWMSGECISDCPSGDYPHDQRTDRWDEVRVTRSLNQLYSQVMDMQAAMQVTVDQVYAITQYLDRSQTGNCPAVLTCLLSPHHITTIATVGREWRLTPIRCYERGWRSD